MEKGAGRGGIGKGYTRARTRILPTCFLTPTSENTGNCAKQTPPHPIPKEPRAKLHLRTGAWWFLASLLDQPVPASPREKV